MDAGDGFPIPLGEAAALGCAACWALSSVFFSVATRRAGASAVNQFRLVLACIFLVAAVAVSSGLHGLEAAPPPRQALLLAASGIVGLTLGDAALFRAWHILGARRVSLLTALAPIFVAVLATAFLGERFGGLGAAGMLVTLAGVAWVILDRTHGGETTHGSVSQGVALGIVAAAGQAAGGVLSKAGLGQAVAGTPLGEFASGGGPAQIVSPLVGTLLRMCVGCAGLLVFTIPTGRLRTVPPVWRDRTTLLWAVAGTIVGPTVGVWLSLVAFANTEAAVAQTILALAPVLVLPAGRLLTGQRATARSYAGALVAVAGVALLAFRHRL